MTVLIDVLWIVSVIAALVFYTGWGLALLLTPTTLRDRAYVLMPFVGLFLIDSLSHLASYAGLTGNGPVWIIIAVATLANVALIAGRRDLVRRPNRFEMSLAACALPALLLGVLPMLIHGTLLPIGDSNADPIAYCTSSSYLREFGMRHPVPVSLEHPVNVPVHGMVQSSPERLGFEFFHIGVNILSGATPPQSFSVVCALGLYLWSLAVGFAASVLLPAASAAALLAAFLFSINAFPIWMAYGGYAPQVLGMGLLVMAFMCWCVAVEERTWRAVATAAILSAALAGIYSDCLLFLLVPAVIFAAGYTLLICGLKEWRKIATIFLGGGVLTVLANPIGWMRAPARFIKLSVQHTAGNVDWIIDARQVVGLVPFGKHVTGWFATGWTNALWLATVFVLVLAVLGLISISRRSKLIAASFLIPHLGSLVMFRIRAYPYGYFKGWSMGLFMYAALLATGLAMLRNWKKQATAARCAGAFAGLSIAGCLAVSSVTLARSMTSRFACTPDVAELETWAEKLHPNRPIYVHTGDISPVTVFWIAYFLRDFPSHFDTPVKYTGYKAQPYSGEPLVILYRKNETPDEVALWSRYTIRQNDSFSLLSLHGRGKPGP